MKSVRTDLSNDIKQSEFRFDIEWNNKESRSHFVVNRGILICYTLHRRRRGKMKKILVLFLVLSLFSGCGKKDITYECEINQVVIRTVVVITVTGNYKLIKEYNVTTFLYLADVDDVQEAAAGAKMEYPNAIISIEGYTLKIYVDYIDEILPSINEETLNEELEYLESLGAICEISE